MQPPTPLMLSQFDYKESVAKIFGFFSVFCSRGEAVPLSMLPNVLYVLIDFFLCEVAATVDSALILSPGAFLDVFVEQPAEGQQVVDLVVSLGDDFGRPCALELCIAEFSVDMFI